MAHGGERFAASPAPPDEPGDLARRRVDDIGGLPADEVEHPTRLPAARYVHDDSAAWPDAEESMQMRRRSIVTPTLPALPAFGRTPAAGPTPS